MVNTVQVNAGRGRDFHPLADHTIKFAKFVSFQRFHFNFN